MEIRSLSLSRDRQTIDAFYTRAGIRLDAGITALCGVYEGETLLALGGLAERSIRSLAVEDASRGEGLLSLLVSHLYRTLRENGAENVFVVTKPVYAPLFVSLGFHKRAEIAEAALLESRGDALDAFLSRLPRSDGAIVMNADPFTNGHLHLVTTAAARAGQLLVLVLASPASHVPPDVRLRLVREGCAALKNVSVVSGGDYVISAATFPDYFLKDPNETALAHARLDCTLFAERIAPACGIKTRFVGEEPLDLLTSGYNDALLSILPPHGVSVAVVPRREFDGAPISASRVRALWRAGELAAAAPLVPPATFAYLKENRP